MGILNRADKRQKTLPAVFEMALNLQAGKDSFDISNILALHNKADESNEEPGDELQVSSKTPTEQNHIPPFIPFAAGFSAGAGSTAGSIGYGKEIAPTLKGSAGGNCMPSVFCLNDQGGSVMDVTEEKTGTLRAQIHGHAPLVFDAHGQDTRYRGPVDRSPTLSASLLNHPLVVDRQTSTLSRKADIMYFIRRLTPMECERLQGFPDGWTDIPGASDSSRYKALGNSVAVPCVQYLIHRVALCLMFHFQSFI